MLVPIGHEEDEVRRLPWVSIVILVSCILVYYLTGLEEDRAEEIADERLSEVVGFYFEHPYLELDEELADEVGWWMMGYALEQGFALDADADFSEFEPDFDDEDVGTLQKEQEQKELARLMSDWRQARDDVPLYKWGLVPSNWQIGDLFASMFMHVGLFHLIGNLLFLWLSGPPLEDVWGRPFFAAFYLLAGALAGLLWVARYASSDIPMIGASGAVAGLMGAFMVRFWAVKIRMFYFFFIGFRFYTGTFSSPAWVMLGLWFGSELFWAVAFDDVAADYGGVANLVHVGGFAFGAGTAAVLRHLKTEEKVFRPKIDTKLDEEENTAVEEAHELRAQGRLEEAWARLAGEVKQNRGNFDAHLGLWDLAVQMQRPEDGKASLLHYIRHELRIGEGDLAVNHWLELTQQLPDVEIELDLRIRLAEAMLTEQRDEQAADLLARVDGDLSALPTGVRVRLARAAARSRSAGAPAICEPLIADPAVPEPVRQEISELYGRAKAQGLRTREAEAGGVPDDAPLPLSEEAPVHRVLKVMPAIPKQLIGDKISVDLVGQGARLLPLKNVQAVAAARIDEGLENVFVVIDLLVDSLWSDKEKIRTVRLRSHEFDARVVMSSQQDPHQALIALIENLVTISGATPIPDADAIKGQPFYSFASLPEYESKVFGFVAG